MVIAAVNGALGSEEEEEQEIKASRLHGAQGRGQG